MASDEHGRSRAEQAADWIGWHLIELAAVGVPAVLAATVAVWLVSLSAVAALAWTAAEIRATRTTRPALERPSAARPSLPARPAPAGTDDAEDRPSLYGDPS
jgi:hypothetical protein